MKIALIIFATACASFFVLLWLLSRIDYRVGRNALKITLLGMPIRAVPFANIEYASKHGPDGLAEKYYNTFKTSHRLLTIQKSRGFPKFLCITPKNRYVLLREIKIAVLKVNPEAKWAKVKDFEPIPNS
ncbi:MAG: hypothetical protein ACTHMT_04225 [Verrucomicrobiota bacterium]